MKKPNLTIDDSLIISRLQQKELQQVKSITGADALYFPLITEIALTPFFDSLPIKLGIKLETIGNQIIGTTIEKGYFHHNIENHLSTLSPANAMIAIERLNLDLPIFFQAALKAGWDDIIDRPRDPIESTRIAIALEVARVFHHLSVARQVFCCLALSSQEELAEYCLHLLDQPIRLFRRFYLTGSGVTTMSIEEMDRLLTELAQIVDDIIASVNFEEKIFQRLLKKAIITPQIAGALGLTGPFLRANRHFYDLRHLGINQPYETIPKISVTEGGDACARFFLRLFETEASLMWLRTSIDNQKSHLTELKPLFLDDEIFSQAPVKKFGFGEVEAPEGDLKISLFLDNNNLIRYRVRSPAYFIAQAIPHLLHDLALFEMATMLYSLGITAEEVDK